MTFLPTIQQRTCIAVCCILPAYAMVAAAEARTSSTLRDLAPIRLYAVPEISVEPPQPLPDPHTEDLPWVPFRPDDSAASDTLPIPDIPYAYFWDETDFRQWHKTKVASTSPGLRGSHGWRRTPRLRSRWLSAPSLDPWTFGASNWRYTGEQGLDVSLGNNEIAVPAWGNTARMGGISVSQSSQTSSDSKRWQYTMSVGALDYSSSQPQGDLNYGPTATNTVLRYQINPEVTLESQLETAPNLITSGVGGRYATDWGAWSAGVAKASYGMHQGWRYQAAYEVNVIDDLQLSWLTERHTAGFTDLSRYADGVSAGGVRQQVSAIVPLGRWGDVVGMYESAKPLAGDAQRSFGLTQQFWYSPNLRIGLKAERQLISGDYDVGIRFSVPIN